MDKTRIMVVDDDGEIRQLLKTLLESEGHEVLPAPGGAEALQMVDDDVDLIILDVMMPGMSGYSACSELRKITNAPILFLTAKGLDSDLTMGYSCGGDDYLTKPFSCAELLARVKGLLRRYHIYRGKESAAPDKYLSSGGLEVNAEFNEAFKCGRELNLTELEYQILRLLLSHRGKVLSAQMLYETVWNEPYFSISANTVMVHIRKLRAKIEDDPQRPAIIKTVWGKGYRVE